MALGKWMSLAMSTFAAASAAGLPVRCSWLPPLPHHLASALGLFCSVQQMSIPYHWYPERLLPVCSVTLICACLLTNQSVQAGTLHPARQVFSCGWGLYHLYARSDAL